jgi:hypothetical protein
MWAILASDRFCIRSLNTSRAGRVRLIQQAIALPRTDKGINGSPALPVMAS